MNVGQSSGDSSSSWGVDVVSSSSWGVAVVVGVEVGVEVAVVVPGTGSLVRHPLNVTKPATPALSTVRRFTF